VTAGPLSAGQAGIELGARPTKTFLVEHSEHGLAVVEMFDARFGDAIGEVVSIVDALLCLRHPNLGQVHWAGRVDSGVAVTSEYVEGESLADLVRASNGALPLEIRLRVFVDVLAGLNAVHGADLAIGTLAPSSVVVGTDGIARIVGVYRSALGSRAVPSTERRMLAPEIELGHDPAPASDVFSIGVMLWEALARRTLHNPRNAEAPPVPAGSPWAEPLCALAARALVIDPAKRPTPAEMAAQIRLASRSKLATPKSVARAVAEFASEHVVARRARLAQSSGKVPIARVANTFDADTSPRGRSLVPANDAPSEFAPEAPTKPRLAPSPTLPIVSTPAAMEVQRLETGPNPVLAPPRPSLASTGSHVLPPKRFGLWIAAAAVALLAVLIAVVSALHSPREPVSRVVPVVQPSSPGAAAHAPATTLEPTPTVRATGSASATPPPVNSAARPKNKPVLKRPGQYDPASI
jgi:hypothetical protein